MKLKKILTLMCCAVLLVCISVGATVAYLTSQDTVTNTFTIGNVKITLDEAEVNTDGTYVSNKDNRTDSNEYKLMPGHTYIKDPIVHVDSESENCWLFVKIENEIAAIEDQTATIESQMTAKGWTKVEGETNVYSYEAISTKGANVPVFDTFKIDGTKDIAGYAGKTIKITAYAVQADGFTTSDAAWTAAVANGDIQ